MKEHPVVKIDTEKKAGEHVLPIRDPKPEAVKPPKKEKHNVSE